MFTTVASRLLKPRAVGVLPTDTVYGLVARAADPEAVARLYSLKERENKPGTLIAASIEQLTTLGIKRRYLTAVEQYWPGAVSVVISCDAKLQYLHQGKFSLAVRVPDNEELQALLAYTGPLITSSANLPGEPTAETIVQAKDIFGDKVDFYFDGGEIKDRQPSTVIRIADDAIEILRAGAVDIEV